MSAETVFNALFVDWGISLGFTEETMKKKIEFYYRGLSYCDMKILKETFFEIFEGYNDEYRHFPSLDYIRQVYARRKPKKQDDDLEAGEWIGFSAKYQSLLTEEKLGKLTEKGKISLSAIRKNGWEKGFVFGVGEKTISEPQSRKSAFAGYEYTVEEDEDGVQMEF